MTPVAPTLPRWTTSSFDHLADALPLELSALRTHLEQCQRQRGRLFTLRCLAEATHGLLAARFVTTLAAALLVLVAGAGLVVALAA